MADTDRQEKQTSSSSPLLNSGATTNVTSGGDLFSPTSAAAWALSTLHNFGAAAPNDNSSRPTTDSLTGTRLFNNVGVSNPDSDGIPAPSSEPNQVTRCSMSTSHTQAATTGVTWGQPQFQNFNNPNFVGPSPHIVRTDEIHVSGSARTDKPLARSLPSTSTVTPTPKKIKVDGNPGSSTYSRKKKSLGVLAENFLNHYKKLPRGSVIIVDHAAVDLGVERRRIYDVVNILESVSLVTKKQKNTYSWMGMNHLDDMFGDLQAKAIVDYPDDAKLYLDSTISINAAIADRNSADLSNPSRKNKENKSLAKLSQEFLQVFLVGFETLSLPEASDKIQGTTSMEELIAMGGGARAKSTAEGDIPDARELKAAAARGLKTKIRRLYDIANVFLSVGLLRKVENVDTSRRPNFAWNYKLSAQEVYKRYRSKQSTELQPAHGNSCSLSETLSAIAASVRNQA